ncbi:MAG TPA: hypothetical protein VGW34_04955 [Allosphingosinicella sp.]|nr:hypothetical protein [Allosphingosinicella sp.]
MTGGEAILAAFGFGLLALGLAELLTRAAEALDRAVARGMLGEPPDRDWVQFYRDGGLL